jgi:hypothetical protein
MVERGAISDGVQTMLRPRFLAFLVVVAACASPTLPLPPPEAPTLEAGADANHLKLVAPCGGAESGAVIVIINTNPALAGDLAVNGSLVNACGAWDAVVYAHTGDALDITQEFGQTRSPPTVVLVP